MVKVRKAAEADRGEVALCIAEGFEKDFAVLCDVDQKVADAIAPALNLERFYVAEAEGGIAGVMAISDGSGRAARADGKALRKYLGFVKGTIGYVVLKEEFEGKVEIPDAAGYIEFVAVRKSWRRQGVASEMIQESMRLSGYRDFVLDVTDVNVDAFNCYRKIGFEVYRRVPEKHAKQKGFGAKVWMRFGLGKMIDRDLWTPEY
ncbi:MAG: GNAT family N-acetyltransferase [Candidatus Spyradocola sp.]